MKSVKLKPIFRASKPTTTLLFHPDYSRAYDSTYWSMVYKLKMIQVNDVDDLLVNFLADSIAGHIAEAIDENVS